MGGFNLDDYVPVPERIAAFYAEHPDGRIVSSPPEVRVVGDRFFIEVTARVYRTPDDPTPCIGSAWEPYPGRTPYTKDSEMMNAETSAIGRALAAAGIKISRSLASREEVVARQEPADSRRPRKVTAHLRADSVVVDAVVDRMNRLPDHVRAEAKRLFVAEFGNPIDLPAEKADAALAFVQRLEDTD